MTVTEVFEQAKALSLEERKELTKLLIDTLDSDETEPHRGKPINQMLDEMDPIEFVDSHIEDPVEWVKAQRQKREDQLKPYRDGESD